MENPYIEGQVILIDKPLDWTSFNAVQKVKYALQKKYSLKKIKVGHAGTLDPLATGLLIICTGKKTKTIESIQEQKKEYTGVITLGATTPSYDLETEIDERFPTDHITKEMIEEGAKKFTGEIDQMPPDFSAKKIDGRRAYKIARKGEKPALKSKLITIYAFDVDTSEFPKIRFRIECSKGTYIRSIAYDLGKALQSGGHLTELRRTKIGDYNVNNAIVVEDFFDSLETI
jgi:tRNA pseudouridine55 synthase